MKKAKKKMASDVVIQLACLVFSCVIGNAQGFHYPNMPKLKKYTNTMSLDPSHVHRIVAFGDSLTEGALQSGNKYHPYTTLLEDLLNDEFNRTRFELYNEGMSGETVFMSMATRLPRILDRLYRRRIDLVIILGGTNDLRKLDCGKYVNVAYEIVNLHKMVHKRGIYTLLCTIPEMLNQSKACEENRVRVNKKLKHFALTHRNNTLFLDLSKEFPLRSLSTQERVLYWDDALHPSRVGYDRIAELVFNVTKHMYDAKPKAQSPVTPPTTPRNTPRSSNTTTTTTTRAPTTTSTTSTSAPTTTITTPTSAPASTAIPWPTMNSKSGHNRTVEDGIDPAALPMVSPDISVPGSGTSQ